MCSDGLLRNAEASVSDRFSDLAEAPPPEPKQGRLKICQMRENMDCSVVGTCLTQSDLTRILSRCGLQPEADVTPYQLHCYAVRQICLEGPLARAAQKLLDKRHDKLRKYPSHF